MVNPRHRSARLARKNKVLVAVGVVMVAVGTIGMIIVGSQAIDSIQDQRFQNTDEAKLFQSLEYVFMFTMIGGLVLVLYSLVSLQSKRAEERESAERRIRSDRTTDATEAA